MFRTVAKRAPVYGAGAGLACNHRVEKVLCPPFTALLAVASLLKGQRLPGRTNMHWELSALSQANFTHHAGGAMPLCDHWHSERRTYSVNG